MVFTTEVFLFFFFPICLLFYFVADWLSHIKKIGRIVERFRVKDLVLIAFSFGFYMASSIGDLFRLVLYIFAVYLLGLWIKSSKAKGYYICVEQSQGSQKRLNLSLFVLIAAVIFVTFFLLYYNYYNFIGGCWNRLFRDNIAAKVLIAPIGISFITFSAISYLTDIYRGHAPAGSLIDCALYLSFFPKIISGPIVLWKDFHGQIKPKPFSFGSAADGINRIMIGFAKKVLLADVFGACLAKISLSPMDRVTAFGTLILYTLRIYYDFSGYSDIAIGTAKLFGFDFKENFNFPYRSTSITEFWRRWHISLGTWFKEYIYFPLGGSRKGKYKTLRNLAIVFALTGIWHGAGWNYVIWGFINGLIVVIERSVADKRFYIKTPKVIKYTVTMLIVMLFWQLFRFNSLSEIFSVFGAMLGRVPANTIPYNWQYYYDTQIVLFAAIGILGSTLFGAPSVIALRKKFSSTKVGYIIQELVLFAVFVVAIMYMVSSGYSPFIYFQY